MRSGVWTRFTRLSLGDLLFVKSRKAKAERCLTFLLVVAFLLFTVRGRGVGAKSVEWCLSVESSPFVGVWSFILRQYRASHGEHV